MRYQRDTHHTHSSSSREIYFFFVYLIIYIACGVCILLLVVFVLCIHIHIYNYYYYHPLQIFVLHTHIIPNIIHFMPKWSFLKKKEEPDLQQEREREGERAYI